MQNTNTNKERIDQFVDELFANGKTPSDYFGISWQSLCELELAAPQVVCQPTNDESQLKKVAY